MKDQIELAVVDAADELARFRVALEEIANSGFVLANPGDRIDLLAPQRIAWKALNGS